MPPARRNGLSVLICRHHAGSLASSAFILIVCLFASLSVPSLLDAQQMSEKIVAVEVQGNDRVANRRVLGSAQINEGDDYSIFNVRRAIKNLWDTGLYTDINILAEEVEGGLKVIIRVKESPIVSRLEIKGNKKIKEQDIKDAIPLRIGGLFSPSRIQESINKIISLYEQKGYYNTRIETTTDETSAPGRIEISIDVDEGQKIRITDIVFDGNENFPDKKLRGALSTKEKSWLRFWRGGGYNDEKFRKDLTEKLPEFYQKHGFVNAQVLGHDLEFKEKGRDVTIRISVDEGQQFYVGTIDVTGNSHFPDAAILRSFTIREGQVFNEEKFKESIDKVRELYGDEGYIYLQAQPLREQKDSLINVNLVLNEGEPATVRKIVIRGNESTFEDVIRRRIMLYPGDLFRQPLVKASYQNLVNSGFFEQDIGVEPRPVAESNEVDLVFNVKEKHTGSANFGAGFGGGYGMTAFLDLTQSNLFGRGKSVQLRLEIGSRMNNVDLSYMDPYFLNTPVSFDVGIFNMRRRLRNDPFQDRYKGFYTRFGFPTPFDYVRFYTGYSLQSIDIRGDSSLIANLLGANVNSYPQTSSKITLSLIRDTRFNTQHPKSGTYHSLDAKFSGGPFGGNIGFQKYEFDSRWYIPTVGQTAVLGLRAKGGTMKPFGGASSPVVDFRELYVLGGTGYGRETDIHLRGYDDRTVGVDGVQYNRGRTYFVASVEEEIEITKMVFGVLFAEAGNVWSDLSTFDPAKLRRSAGFGLRLETPMGPLGLEFGYGFDRTDEYGNRTKGGWQPHFRFGRFY